MIFKKFIAHIKRYIHLSCRLFVFDINHMEYTIGTSYYIKNIEIWFISKEIGCTCGKIWYSELNKDDKCENYLNGGKCQC